MGAVNGNTCSESAASKKKIRGVDDTGLPSHYGGMRGGTRKKARESELLERGREKKKKKTPILMEEVPWILRRTFLDERREKSRG